VSVHPTHTPYLHTYTDIFGLIYGVGKFPHGPTQIRPIDYAACLKDQQSHCKRWIPLCAFVEDLCLPRQVHLLRGHFYGSDAHHHTQIDNEENHNDTHHISDETSCDLNALHTIVSQFVYAPRLHLKSTKSEQ
jgi:hypothetical protein